jgi:hypothetical protein
LCKIITDVPKITKRDPFFSFQSKMSIFHDERASFTLFPGTKKARTVRLQPQKSTILPSKNKRRHRDKHTNTQNKERPEHSKFKFKIQIARKNAHEVVSGAKKVAPRLVRTGMDDAVAVSPPSVGVPRGRRRRRRATVSLIFL